MTDIVERLRATQDDWPACLVVLEQEAADEIERLRERVKKEEYGFEVFVKDYQRIVDEQANEIERLRDALRKIAEWDLTGTAIAALEEKE